MRLKRCRWFKKDLPLTEHRQSRRVNVVKVAVITYPGRFIFVYSHFVCFAGSFVRGDAALPLSAVRKKKSRLEYKGRTK